MMAEYGIASTSLFPKMRTIYYFSHQKLDDVSDLCINLVHTRFSLKFPHQQVLGNNALHQYSQKSDS